jgi:hypothetical protein
MPVEDVRTEKGELHGSKLIVCGSCRVMKVLIEMCPRDDWNGNMNIISQSLMVILNISGWEHDDVYLIYTLVE